MTILNDLLRIDAAAREYGCGLKPGMREALAADLRWPSKRAAPVPVAPVDPDGFSENVVRLGPSPETREEKQA
ncbi:hypothetical protein GCM10007385_00070 [Tateyamaria omphalii]|uniref:hypothetical protein n=1 Tax=Tateyamaria omphalii TaxID=299262 RepID=UPI0016787922|nr:hypothetical protein [Tateyamaria omphalii]GGX37523.1 hypothetical protein GCM10007385_00070 [Tateyamaria omphalii]